VKGRERGIDKKNCEMYKCKKVRDRDKEGKYKIWRVGVE